ncbi:MAG: A/G-specific adenine glycosylase [Bacteroidales bacterium]|nr:A/G-specific adenine glycosylase [Bacteroidales bacterium]
MDISRFLQSWYLDNRRLLPWRETSDAYCIWLSEIILQQTRVAQGYDYYMRFVATYPTVQQLAAAPLDDVLKLWQGLGYYSRARLLHRAAQMVASGSGTFPSRYEELMKLPGVGPYTAAAIASFASGQAVAVVDGNVYRVLARLFDIDLPIDSTAGRKHFQQLADELLDPDHAGLHNQAMMELGALVCTPTSPRCTECPVADACAALAHHTIGLRPRKVGRVKVRQRRLHYYIFKYGDDIWVHQRAANDIWLDLWEYYLHEEGDDTPIPPEALGVEPAFTYGHRLTHQQLLCSFYIVPLTQPITTLPSDYVRMSWRKWQEKAVAKPIFEANRRFSALFSTK